MAVLDFFSTYMLQAAVKEIVPKKSFFKDRYFPTAASDLFSTDKVLIEYQDGDRKIAPFVSDRIGDIPVERPGYRVSEYAPAKIAPSRILTIDDLKKRGFGEAIYSETDEASRAGRLQLQDMTDIDLRITRREEWMAVQTMINNGCTVQEYIDAKTAGEQKHILFYQNASNHTYTVSSSKYWDGNNADIYADVDAMCGMLSERGLEAADLVLGSAAANALKKNAEIRANLNTTSNIMAGSINETLTGYAGVVFMGMLNFNGFLLNVFCVNETYVDDSNVTQKYFPAKAAMVTAPGCGHMMYGSVTQINYGETEFSTIVGARVPKLIVDQENDIRKLRLTARPLAAPKAYCPYIYAAQVVQ